MSAVARNQARTPILGQIKSFPTAKDDILLLFAWRDSKMPAWALLWGDVMRSGSWAARSQMVARVRQVAGTDVENKRHRRSRWCRTLGGETRYHVSGYGGAIVVVPRYSGLVTAPTPRKHAVMR